MSYICASLAKLMKIIPVVFSEDWHASIPLLPVVFVLLRRDDVFAACPFALVLVCCVAVLRAEVFIRFFLLTDINENESESLPSSGFQSASCSALLEVSSVLCLLCDAGAPILSISSLVKTTTGCLVRF